MSQDISIEGVSVDSSNKIGLYGDDLANITGAVTEIVNNSLLTTAANTAATKETVAALASSSAHQTASVANAGKMNKTILFIIAAGIALFIFFGRRRRR